MYRLILLLLLLLLLLLPLSGCQLNQAAYVWADPGTTGEYLDNDLVSAFIPRLGSNGQHICQ